MIEELESRVLMSGVAKGTVPWAMPRAGGIVQGTGKVDQIVSFTVNDLGDRYFSFDIKFAGKGSAAKYVLIKPHINFGSGYIDTATAKVELIGNKVVRFTPPFTTTIPAGAKIFFTLAAGNDNGVSGDVSNNPMTIFLKGKTR